MAHPRSNRRTPVVPAPLTLDGGEFAVADVVAVARAWRSVRIAPASVKRMAASRRVVDHATTDGLAHYGINTGFGSLSQQRISAADLATLQRNLVRSHAAGVGSPLPVEIVRAMMLLLAGSLARGFSGVRPVVAETIVAMLNAGITPVVPSVGSVGASGDLAPLAAAALVAIGEGQAFTERSGRPASHPGEPIPGDRALKRAGIRPLELAAKEGLALINGTHLMAARAALLAEDYERLLDSATVALAMSIDACRASHDFLDHRLYLARNQLAGGAAVCETLRSLLRDSAIRTSHRDNDPRVQDPYSLRAAPTVLGVVSDFVGEFQLRITQELGAVTDNPLVFPKGAQLCPHWTGALEEFRATSADDAIISGANFHGAPLAIPLDCLAIHICHLAGISERRTYLMTGAFEPESNLKPFLAPRPGLQSGLMIAQYTAAACVNELVGLAAPASVANIPTSAGMEDYNSFGPRAAAKAERAVELARQTVAIEFLCAAQGLEFHRPLKSGAGVEAAHAVIRKAVRPLTDDRPLTADIEAIAELIRLGHLTPSRLL